MLVWYALIGQLNVEHYLNVTQFYKGYTGRLTFKNVDQAKYMRVQFELRNNRGVHSILRNTIATGDIH